jgi:hypothetical protein
VAVAAAAALVWPLAGCSEDGPADGFRRLETGWMTIDVPEGWVEATASGPWTEAYQDAEGQDATALLSLAPQYGQGITALEATSDIVGSAQLGAFPDFTVVVPPTEPTDDADFARRATTRFTYTGDDGQTLDGVLWGVADDEHAVLVQLTGEDLDDALLETVGESIRVTG